MSPRRKSPVLITHGFPASVADIVDVDEGRNPPAKLTIAAYVARLTDEERRSFVVGLAGRTPSDERVLKAYFAALTDEERASFASALAAANT